MGLQGALGSLKGSIGFRVVTSGVISRVTILINHIWRLITPLITALRALTAQITLILCGFFFGGGEGYCTAVRSHIGA